MYFFIVLACTLSTALSIRQCTCRELEICANSLEIPRMLDKSCIQKCDNLMLRYDIVGERLSTCLSSMQDTGHKKRATCMSKSVSKHMCTNEENVELSEDEIVGGKLYLKKNDVLEFVNAQHEDLFVDEIPSPSATDDTEKILLVYNNCMERCTSATTSEKKPVSRVECIRQFGCALKRVPEHQMREIARACQKPLGGKRQKTYGMKPKELCLCMVDAGFRSMEGSCNDDYKLPFLRIPFRAHRLLVN